MRGRRSTSDPSIPLREELGRQTDRMLWVEEMGEDEVGGELFQTHPLRPGRTGLVGARPTSVTNEAIANHPRRRQTASLGCAAWQQKSCRCGSA